LSYYWVIKIFKIIALLFAFGERKKDWFIKFHFIRASHGELPFERAEIIFGFQKSV